MCPRHLNLLTQTQPHLLPEAAEAALQNSLHHTDPLRGRVAHSIWRPRLTLVSRPGEREARRDYKPQIRQFPAQIEFSNVCQFDRRRGCRGSIREEAGISGRGRAWNRGSAGRGRKAKASSFRLSPELQGAVSVIFGSRGGTNLQNAPFINLFTSTKKSPRMICGLFNSETRFLR